MCRLFCFQSELHRRQEGADRGPLRQLHPQLGKLPGLFERRARRGGESNNEADFTADGHLLYRAKHTGVDTDRSEDSILPAYGPQALGLTHWINTKLPQYVCDVWLVSTGIVKAVLLLFVIVLEKKMVVFK
ncbi:unnamed protein product [Ixodes pacificus]